LQLDAGSATHPVVMPVVSIDGVSQAFDEISYSKGGTVIRMIEATIGEAGFRDGMRRYMKRYAYGNANTDQLWAELQAATGKPVPAIAHDFTLQPGVPLVRVEEAACKDDVTTLQLTQARFETDGTSAQKLAWRIPLQARSIGGTGKASVITQPGAPVALQLPGCAPVIVNAGHAGYFRTLYGPVERDRLRKAFPDIAEIDQLGLLSDAWALGNVGLVPATTYLDFVEAVAADSDPLIWTQIASRLGAIDRIFDGSPEQATWRRLARAILSPQLQRIGWLPTAGQDDNVALLRENLIEALGDLHDEAVITEARARFSRSAGDPSALPAAIRSAVMVVTAQHADESTWNEILERGRKESDPLEKQRWYVWLGRTVDPVLAKRALELAVSGEPPSGVGPTMMGVVADRHSELAFDFAVANEKALSSLVEVSSRWRFVPALARPSGDPMLARKLQAYSATAVPLDARQDSEKAIAEIERRARSRALSRPQLESWARDRQESVAPVQVYFGKPEQKPAVMKSP
jgi:aminopeptidase N